MSVRRYASAPLGRRRTPWAIALAIVVLGVTALIVAAPGSAPRKPQKARARSASPNVVPRAPAQRSAPTRAGAVEAAVRGVYRLALPALTDSGSFERSLATLSAPGREPAVRAAFAAGSEKLRSGLVGGMVRSAPLGYRIEQFDGRAAAVSIWVVSLAAGPHIATQATWRRLTFDLRWERGRWLVTGGAGGAAPSPSSSGEAAVLEASTYRELPHEP